ncbi:acetyl-CoA C-acyltransferase [Saccharolobus solfataricus]|uniref:Acetyl-CoA c-acetyltransferase (Acetoacetyl-CoA thiolase) (AcaB-4) n=4 Tax=Saccharolobus solfataricus TaxID=2287 RepID=Q97W61_SACS2|nr:Acetyl-CoA c-acetyltransferase (acetoacetyl-CoA thiolase) (acaB-4) [Saccharolobus solfataricus P2]AKA72624.1 acetyl-CoA C-acyltransferase [Saccharolobus solfataricus]AKA75323.1 acetyl-CoA C-acyltransferase [Saccharolobus solfataricus]AKA78016.1 acetyl-CoA C-acyltransferase [Saccharolobus solfataricus]AZF67135.1 acetyl-CoA C-acyltransferase [Saccharolobus solfataricus]
MPESVYIASAVRTPIGKFGGALRNLSPVDLGSIVIREALRRANVEPGKIDMAIMGNVLRAGHGQDIARQCAISAGIPFEIDGFSVDMVCSSGMISVITASQMIKSGDADIIVAGGTENMSQAMFAIKSDIRWGVKMLMNRNIELIDTMLYDGLTDPFQYKVMGQEADMVAKSHNISRKELDEVAYQSHLRAHKATVNGYFKSEIVEIKADGKVINTDEGIRADTSLDKLSSLPPAFTDDGLHTAGNSSQISDGAAALVLVSEKAAKELKIEPIARILGYSWVGIESWRFTEAPIFAIKKLLSKLDTDINHFDYFENNEAFAVNNVLINRYLGIPYDRLNVFGGAIALGHPIGASGARIIVTLLNVLSKMHGTRGIASICHGIGGSTAIAIELLKEMK